VIDALARAVVATIQVGDEPVGVAVAPDGGRVYITNRRSNTVSVVNTASKAVIATIDGVGPSSNGIGLTPDGGFAYVNNASSKNPGTLSVIDTALEQTVASVEVARNPKRVAIAPDGLTAYVANFRSWNISVVDIPTNTFITGLRVSGRTVGVAVHPNGQYAYVTNLDGTVEIIDTSTNLLSSPIAVGHEPYAIALSRQGGTAYVANLGDDTVSIVDLGADVEIGTVPVGDKPFAIAVGCIGDCNAPPFTPKQVARRRHRRRSRRLLPSPRPCHRPKRRRQTPMRRSCVSARWSGHPGETVDLPVTFDSLGAELAGIQLDIHYAPPLAFAANADELPDCTLAAAVPKDCCHRFSRRVAIAIPAPDCACSCCRYGTPPPFRAR
jgi:YVTN family beta-propeller protein